MKTEEFSLDGLYCKKWLCENEKAAVQIIHGLGEMTEYYEQLAAFFSKNGVSVYMCELRSHGRTLLPSDTEDVMSDMIEDCKALSDYIGKNHRVPVFLLGHSMGATAAQLYLKKYGAELAGVILTGCAYFKNIGRLLTSIEREIRIRGREAASVDTFLMLFSRVAERFPEKCSVSWVTSDLERAMYYEKLPYTNRQYSCSFYKSFLKAASLTQEEDFPKTVSHKPPVLIACGEADSVGGYGKYPPVLASHYANAGFDTRLFMYENARHSILQEKNREEIYADIIGFISDNCR